MINLFLLANPIIKNMNLLCKLLKKVKIFIMHIMPNKLYNYLYTFFYKLLLYLNYFHYILLL